MGRARTAAVGAVLAALLGAWTPGAAHARPWTGKAVFGPVARGDGTSFFPLYRDLGVGVFQYRLRWRQVAPERPKAPSSARERTYIWPAELDYAIAQARLYGMQVAITISDSPTWASLVSRPSGAPVDPDDLARFAAAAARRYPAVRRWRIWDDVNNADSLSPSDPTTYAEMLDAAYGQIKRVRPKAIVIGGNTSASGAIAPLTWVSEMLLLDGRRPRLDEYGHNPFGERAPQFGLPPAGTGNVDFASLEELGSAVDAAFGRRGRVRRTVRLFLARYSVVSDHPAGMSTFFLPRETQADWVTRALAIGRSWRRVTAVGWDQLIDDPPAAGGTERLGGLLDAQQQPKPSYFAFRDG